MKLIKHLKFLNSIVANSAGVSVDGKYLVFESDDWGAIRMPDRDTFDKFERLGIKSISNSFNIYDSLESPSDYIGLFEV